MFKTNCQNEPDNMHEVAFVKY